jgi:hypothetical protein
LFVAVQPLNRPFKKVKKGLVNYFVLRQFLRASGLKRRFDTKGKGVSRRGVPGADAIVANDFMVGFAGGGGRAGQRLGR